MTLLSRATITGPEAAGVAELHDTGGRRQIQLHRLHVAPGAPDVRLYLTPDPAGRIDHDAHDLGHLPDGDTDTVTRDLQQASTPTRSTPSSSTAPSTPSPSAPAASTPPPEPAPTPHQPRLDSEFRKRNRYRTRSSVVGFWGASLASVPRGCRLRDASEMLSASCGGVDEFCLRRQALALDGAIDGGAADTE